MDCNQPCNRSCSCISYIISLVLAIIVGVLFYFNYIQNIVTSVWIAFGLGVLNMIFLVVMILFASLNERSALSKCLNKKGTCYLVGIIGTIIFTLMFSFSNRFASSRT